ncbi:MAG: phycobiliprotein lyase [Thermosynechococcaceae cyanobacterium]
MDIPEFLNLCSGKWVSQRTTHQLIEQKNQSNRSDLQIDSLEPTHADVIALCQQRNIDPALAYGGLQITWSEVTDAYFQSRFKPRNEGQTLLVPILDPTQPDMGQVLRKLSTDISLGTLSLGADETLTLVFDTDGLVAEERMWFASPNLRLRSSLMTQNGTVVASAFCSEIRMIAPPTPAVAETTTAQPNA